jgi:hypothetical protein
MPLITRTGKGSKLSIAEMDDNLTYLEGLADPTYTNILYVDVANGNDTTAQPGNPNLPYKSLNTVIAAATSGSKIHVFPGSASINLVTNPLSNLYKNGVWWHFERGFSLNITSQTQVVADQFLFNITENSGSLRVTGNLEFTASSTGPDTFGGSVGLLQVLAHSVRAYVEVESAVIAGGRNVTISPSGSMPSEMCYVTLKSYGRIANMYNGTGQTGAGQNIALRGGTGNYLEFNLDVHEVENNMQAPLLIREVGLVGSRVRFNVRHRIIAYVTSGFGGGLKWYNGSNISTETSASLIHITCPDIWARGGGININPSAGHYNTAIYVKGSISNGVGTTGGGTTAYAVYTTNYAGKLFLDFDYYMDPMLRNVNAVVANDAPCDTYWTGQVILPATATGSSAGPLFRQYNVSGSLTIKGSVIDKGAVVQLAATNGGVLNLEDFTYKAANNKIWPAVTISGTTLKEVNLKNCIIQHKASSSAAPVVSIANGTTNYTLRSYNSFLSATDSLYTGSVISGSGTSTGKVLLLNTFLAAPTSSYILSGSNNLIIFNSFANQTGSNVGGSTTGSITVDVNLITY